jgi:hypothetical protein
MCGDPVTGKYAGELPRARVKSAEVGIPEATREHGFAISDCDARLEDKERHGRNT